MKKNRHLILVIALILVGLNSACSAATPTISSPAVTATNSQTQGQATQATDAYPQPGQSDSSNLQQVEPTKPDAYPQPNFNNSNYVDEGDKLFAAGSYDEAKKYYNQAIQENVDLARAYAGKAFILNKERRFDEALPYFDQALKVVQTPEYLAGRCTAYRLLKLMDKAQADCDAALALDAGSLNAVIADAMLSADKNNYTKARELLTTATEKNPTSANLWYTMGVISVANSDLEQAIKDYTKSIELDPAQAQFYCDRAFLYYSSAKLDDAKADYQKVVELGIVGKDDECIDRAQNFIGSKK